MTYATETMAYAVKTVLDTWLKSSIVQGSALPDSQKQFVSAGTILPMSGFELVEAGHLKFTLATNAQGKQIQFKGRNTWYVYLPTVQILRNGQPIAVPKPTPVYAVQTVLDTWLKVNAGQGSALSDDQKQFLSSSKVLPLSSYEWVENDHIKLTFGLDAQGKQVQFKGRNTWYVYRPAVRILKDGEAIAFTPSGNSLASGQSSGQSSGQISAKGLKLLKSFEGLRLEAYIDAVGVLTIGYGTTTGVTPGMRITEAQAEDFLKRDLAKFENAVSSLVKVTLNADQFSALVTFTYNVGEGALAGSTLLRLLNQGDFQNAADQLLRWNKGDKGELPGLTRRRQAERALFLSQDFTAFL